MADVAIYCGNVNWCTVFRIIVLGIATVVWLPRNDMIIRGLCCWKEGIEKILNNAFLSEKIPQIPAETNANNWKSPGNSGTVPAKGTTRPFAKPSQ